MNKFCKILLIALIIFPCIFFFNGCSCSSNDKSSNNTNSNITYTVHFYTGTENKFNVPSQEVKEGEKIVKPEISGYYYDPVSKITYSFADWYTDPSFDTQYVWKFTTDTVHENLTLYAKWNEIPSV